MILSNLCNCRYTDNKWIDGYILSHMVFQALNVWERYFAANSSGPLVGSQTAGCSSPKLDGDTTLVDDWDAAQTIVIIWK